MMRFRTFLLISLVIVCLVWIGFFVTLPIGAVVLGVFWICSVFHWIFDKD